MNAKLQLELKGLIRQYGVNGIIEELSNLVFELSHYCAEEGMFNRERELKAQANKLSNCYNTIIADTMSTIERQGLS